MHACQPEAMPVDRLDMHTLSQSGRKSVAVKTDTRQLNPVSLDLNRRPGKLYFFVGDRRLLLPWTVPNIFTRDVILGRAVQPHFLADNEIRLVWRRVASFIAVLVGASQKPR